MILAQLQLSVKPIRYIQREATPIKTFWILYNTHRTIYSDYKDYDLKYRRMKREIVCKYCDRTDGNRRKSSTKLLIERHRAPPVAH